MAFSSYHLLVNYSAANVRLLFRIYFIVFGTTVAPLGQACAAAQVKLRLARGKDVSLSRMLGWLGGFDIVTTVWKIRDFPSGIFLTALMLFAYFVSLASDLVGSYIRSVEVHDRCHFGTGLVLSNTALAAGVPWNGYPYTVVSQAQLLSLNNDGKQGIYAKANEDVKFSAQDVDILGGWQCTQNSLELEYSSQQSRSDIVSDLLAHDLLYSSLTATGVAAQPHATGFEHFVVIDTSNAGVFGRPWDVRVCASSSDPGSDTKTMLCYQCQLQDQVGHLTNVLQGINTTFTIPDWQQLIQGACYDGTGTPARSNLPPVLERIFNSMVMISAGGNYLLDTTQSNATQGCLTTRTWILWEVIALAVATAFLNVFLAAYCVVLKMWELRIDRNQHYSAGTDTGLDTREHPKHIPSNMLEWAIQAVAEAKPYNSPQDVAVVKDSKLKRWHFGWLDGKKRFGIVEAGNQVEEIRLLVNSPK